MKVSPVPNWAKRDAETCGIPGVEASIWTERIVAALVNGVEGGKWYSLMDKVYAPKVLRLAWEKVRANRGAAGVDGQSIERFEARVDVYLAELSEALRSGSYAAQPVKRVDIPKGPGQTRPLGIPTIKDRIVQTAVKLVIEPIFEVQFLHELRISAGQGLQRRHAGGEPAAPERLHPCGGRRPARLLRQHPARQTDGARRSVDQRRVDNGLDLGLAEAGHPAGHRVLDADRGHAVKRRAEPAAGQSLPAPARRPADGAKLPHGAVADDFVILSRSREEADAALEIVRAWVEANGLRLHPDKTHVGDCRQAGQGFDFLGYRFEQGRPWVRKKSLARFKDRIREKTYRPRGDSLTRIVAELNPVLKGWYGYFKHAQHSTFKKIDGFVRRRLRSLLRKQERRPGIGHCLEDQKRWLNAFFAEAGLFALYPAWQTESHSR